MVNFGSLAAEFSYKAEARVRRITSGLATRMEWTLARVHFYSTVGLNVCKIKLGIERVQACTR